MKSNIYDLYKKIQEHWSPKIIASVNDVYVKLAKVKGEIVWHTHEEEDEFFMVIKGSLTIKYENESVYLKEGDFHVVEKGRSHFPCTDEECWILLIENKSTDHTGNTESEMSKSIDEQKW